MMMISTLVVIALMLIPTVVARMKFLTFNRERSGEPKVGKLAVALKFQIYHKITLGIEIDI